MKPIKNNMKPCFQVGHYYVYVGEEEEVEFEVDTIQPCEEGGTCYSVEREPDLCDRTRALDTNGEIWCGVYQDFDDIS